MKMTASFIDVISCLLLIFMATAVLTTRHLEERNALKISLPKAESQTQEAGAAGVSGQTILSAKKEGGAVAFFLGDTRLPSLRAAIETLRHTHPSRVIVQVEQGLPVDVAINVLARLNRLSVPASLAYDPTMVEEDS